MTPTVVVAEKSRNVHFLWGFLTVVFAAALLRGTIGADLTTTLVVVDVVVGVLLTGSIAMWIWARRHPARLEIAPEAVVLSHRGQSNSTRLVGPGELYVRTTYIGGTDKLDFLMVTGSEEAISLQMFDHGEVKTACRASGWRFVGDGDP